MNFGLRKPSWYFTWMFVIALIFETSAQNLAFNEKFEDTLCCPSGIPPTINCAEYWSNPNGGTADFYHYCNYLPNHITEPINDDGYAGIWNFFLGYDGSEMIEGRISTPLINNHKYCMSFLVRPDKVGLVSDGIGIHFSSVFNDTVGMYNSLVPQILNPSGNIFADTSQWSVFSGEFIAQGGEEYFIIGNFRTADSTKWDTIGSTMTTPQGYIFIDNVELYDCTDTTSINETEKFFQTSIYPNPANNVLNLEIKSASNNRFRWKISDVTGRNIQADVCNNDKNKIDVSFLSNGIYFVLINDLTSGLSKTEKFIIKKE